MNFFEFMILVQIHCGNLYHRGQFSVKMYQQCRVEKIKCTDKYAPNYINPFVAKECLK